MSEQPSRQIIPSPTQFVEVETARRLIDGTMLRCVDGRYFAGKENLPFTRKTPLRVRGMCQVLQRFIAQTPSTIWPTEDGVLPDENALNNAIPQTEWQIGKDGQPRKPWQKAFVLYLSDEESFENYTFISATYGGKLAYLALWDRVARARDKSPDATPIVELSDTPMKTAYGVKQRPHFIVRGWLDLDGDAEEVARINGPKTGAIAKAVHEDEDDEEGDVYVEEPIAKPVKRVARIARK